MAPATLPAVRIDGRAWIINLASRQFHEAFNGKHVPFDSVKGCELCRQAAVMTCLHCGASAIVAHEMLQQQLRCVRCGRAIQSGGSPRVERGATKW